MSTGLAVGADADDIRRPALSSDCSGPEPKLPPSTLAGSMRDFRDLTGSNITARGDAMYRWQNARRQVGLWPFSKSTMTAPLSQCEAFDDTGHPIIGHNFASQDYLSLSSHPAIKESAIAAVRDYGVHSAGSAALLGNTRHSLKLEETISDFLAVEHTVLFPTGWAAGYGVITALIREHDHVVMDALGHACLQAGAAAATRNVWMHPHRDVAAIERRLKRIRAKDTENAILVVTESLFSMDSDSPDLAALQSICRAWDATLLVDVAHDLGCLGTSGSGFIGGQGMLGKIDIVMGSFSKTFASNGGFVTVNSMALREYIKFFSSPQTFSNALSPVQAAVVLAAFEIVKSVEGDDLRRRLLERTIALRSALTATGLTCLGEPSAIVPVMVGDEALARVTSREIAKLGVIANLVEFPAVPKGSARFRLQVMAGHELGQIPPVANAMRWAVDEAKRILSAEM